VTAPYSGMVPQRCLLLDDVWHQHTRSSAFGARQRRSSAGGAEEEEGCDVQACARTCMSAGSTTREFVLAFESVV
jgi:hypothetical protein